MFQILAESTGGGGFIGFLILIGLVAVIAKAVTTPAKKKSYDVLMGGRVSER